MKNNKIEVTSNNQHGGITAGIVDEEGIINVSVKPKKKELFWFVTLLTTVASIVTILNYLGVKI